MAWLGTDALPISAGWGPAPQLHAPDISGMVRAILQNRQWQQANTQKNIADAIKQYQEQQQSSTYAEALRNAGLTQGQDISGLDAAHATALAKLIAEQTPDTQRDALLAAQTAEANARAGVYNKASDSGGDGGEPETFIDDQGRTWRKHYDARGRVNWYPVTAPKSDVPTAGTTKTTLSNLGLTGEDILNSKNQYGTLASGERVPAGQPWTSASTINITPKAGGPKVPLSIQKFRELKQALGVPDPNPTPSAAVTPSPNPDVTITPTPPPSDTAAGHAQDYGVKAVYMKAPDGTVSTVDPNLVDYYKSKGAVVVPGPE